MIFSNHGIHEELKKVYPEDSTSPDERNRSEFGDNQQNNYDTYSTSASGFSDDKYHSSSVSTISTEEPRLLGFRVDLHSRFKATEIYDGGSCITPSYVGSPALQYETILTPEVSDPVHSPLCTGSVTYSI